MHKSCARRRNAQLFDAVGLVLIKSAQTDALGVTVCGCFAAIYAKNCARFVLGHDRFGKIIGQVRILDAVEVALEHYVLYLFIFCDLRRDSRFVLVRKLGGIKLVARSAEVRDICSRCHGRDASRLVIGHG